MIDHMSFAINDYQQSLKFYDATLACLGIKRISSLNFTNKNIASYGINGKPSFWISYDSNPNLKEFIGKSRGFHLAFQACSTESVNLWHAKCLELGASNNGTPGFRTIYHPGYYAAFVVDINGYRLEAVFHKI